MKAIQTTDPALIKTIANIITTQILSLSQKTGKGIREIISEQNLIKLARLFQTKQINNQGVVTALEHSVNHFEQDINVSVQKLGLIQVSDDKSVLEFVKQVIQQNPSQTEQYRQGKTTILGFLVGQGMKISGGKGNPVKLKELLMDELEGS